MTLTDKNLKGSIECGTHNTPEARQIVLCDVLHLCQFITIQAWSFLLSGKNPEKNNEQKFQKPWFLSH